jgi:hypothetical protein
MNKRGWPFWADIIMHGDVNGILEFEASERPVR